jgi:Rho-binding antiterminator
MQRPPSINCAQHDYLEVACLYQYEVRITLADGSVIEGRATNTRTDPSKSEYLILTVAGQQVEVPMLALRTLTTRTPGAKFDQIDFVDGAQ